MNDRQVANHIANLRHKDPDVRRHAANALGEIGDPGLVPALIGSLNDRTDYVRRKVAISLRKIGGSAVPALARALKTNEDLVREAAFEALMEFGDASALPGVIEALKDTNVHVRGSAVKVLDKIGDASAVPALVALLQDRYDAMWRERYAAAERKRYAVALVPYPFVASSCLGIRPDRPITRFQHDQVRSDAIGVLGKIGDVSAVPALVEALKDESVLVRCNAADALGRIGDAATVAALIEAWNAIDAQECPRAYGALWSMGDDVVLPRKILADARFSAQERIDILERLRRIHSEGDDLIGNKVILRYQFAETPEFCAEVLQEENADARKGAKSVLNWLNGERHLLHASQEDRKKQSQELVRPSHWRDPITSPKTLLRAQENSVSQAEIAKHIGSDQSHVAKAEKNDPSVSIELMLRVAFALGAKRQQIGHALQS